MTEANCLTESGSATNLLTKPTGSALLFDGRTREGFEQIDAALRHIAEAGETCAAAAIEEGNMDLVDWAPVHAALANAHNVIAFFRQSDKPM